MAKIIAHSGVLTVCDVSTSMAFWMAKLGFSRLEAFGEPPEFAILTRDGAYIMLGKAEGGVVVTRRSQRDGLMDAYFWVDDAKALHAEIAARGATFGAPLELQPYGVLEFMVETPDGHHIAFGQDMSGDIGKSS
jgi:uncharacterized glyoxalase superfamily protein PhnB